MKIAKMLAIVSVISIAMAGLATSPVLAAKPKGIIVKYVQNQSQHGVLTDTDGSKNAVDVKPGDTLRYVIEVRNDGQLNTQGDNDMVKVIITDTLPTGVELISDPAKRGINEELGTIRPGQKLTREYLVKVTANDNGAILSNEACFAGDSAANDSPQSGCDTADVKVDAPLPTTPVEPASTAPQNTNKTSNEGLPQTGAGNFVMPSIFGVALGYALYLAFLKYRSLRNN